MQKHHMRQDPAGKVLTTKNDARKIQEKHGRTSSLAFL